MKIRSRIGRYLCAGAFLLLSATASARQMVLLGDSLSDTGNLFALTGGLLPQGPLYDPGRIPKRFSDGDIWADYLAGQLGLGIRLPWAGQTAADGDLSNYAVANSFTGPYDWAGSLAPPPAPTLPKASNFTDIINVGVLGGPFLGLPGLSEQLGLYLSTGVLREATHVVWAGANDLFFSELVVPAESSVVDQAVVNLRSLLTTLNSVQVEDIIVVNLPDLGATPFARGETQIPFPGGLPDRTAELTAMSIAFNLGLEEMLAGIGFEVELVDIFSLLQLALADPSAFGFDNVSDPCLDLATLAFRCATPDTHLFWDDYHPTTAAHAPIGQLIGNAVPEPPLGALFAIAALTLAGASGLRRRGAWSVG